MKLLRNLLLLSVAFSGIAAAQTPDCLIQFQFTATGNSTAVNNRQAGCNKWIVAYQSSGFSAISLVFQSADGAVSAGTYGNFSGTTDSGANPATNTTGAYSTFTGYVGFARMRLNSVTGTGTVTGVLYGYKVGYASAGAGGTCDALAGDVTGTCDANVVEKVNGVAYAAAPATDSVEVITAANTATAKVLPDCDATRNALNYDTTGHNFSCATIPAQQHVITFMLDGGGSPIATGAVGVFPTAAFACTINRIDVSADVSGSITVDIWKAAGAIPTAGNKISASAPATLSAAQLSQNGSLTGWTTAVSSGDVFGATVATASTVTKVTVQIWCS